MSEQIPYLWKGTASHSWIGRRRVPQVVEEERLTEETMVRELKRVGDWVLGWYPDEGQR